MPCTLDSNSCYFFPNYQTPITSLVLKLASTSSVSGTFELALSSALISIPQDFTQQAPSELSDFS